MTDVFAPAAARAKIAIEAKGRLVELVKLNETPANAARPWEGSSSSSAEPHVSKKGATIPVKMVFVPASGSGFGRMLSNNGTLKIAYSQVGLLAADSIPARFEPEDVRLASKVIDGDRVWAIVTRGELKPATKSVLFVLGLEASA
jgi:hypothetical protein